MLKEKNIKSYYGKESQEERIIKLLIINMLYLLGQTWQVTFGVTSLWLEFQKNVF